MNASSLIRICSFILLCSLLISLLPKMAEASGRMGQKNGQVEQQKDKKSFSSWVQSYKEPKADAQQQQEEEEEEEELTCTIKVQKVEKHAGKCIRLRGGSMACQTGTYLDPMNADCLFLEE